MYSRKWKKKKKTLGETWCHFRESKRLKPEVNRKNELPTTPAAVAFDPSQTANKFAYVYKRLRSCQMCARDEKKTWQMKASKNNEKCFCLIIYTPGRAEKRSIWLTPFPCFPRLSAASISASAPSQGRKTFLNSPRKHLSLPWPLPLTPPLPSREPKKVNFEKTLLEKPKRCHCLAVVSLVGETEHPKQAGIVHSCPQRSQEEITKKEKRRKAKNGLIHFLYLRYFPPRPRC